MGLWDGPRPATTTGYSLNQWVAYTPEFTYSGSEVRWWELGCEAGLTFEPTNCSTGSLTDTADRCSHCSVTDDCENCIPEAVTFEPVWLSNTYACSELRDQQELQSRTVAELEANTGSLLAAHFWDLLARPEYGAEPISDTPVCAEELVGALNDCRGCTPGGVFVASGYAIGRLVSSGVADLSGSRPTLAGKPLIVDDCFDRTGPDGTETPAGSAWVYHLDQPPVAAVRPVVADSIPGDQSCLKCCVTHRARRQAIVAFNPCRVCAALLQVAC